MLLLIRNFGNESLHANFLWILFEKPLFYKVLKFITFLFVNNILRANAY